MLTRFADWLPEPDRDGVFRAAVVLADPERRRSVQFPVAGRATGGRMVVAGTLQDQPVATVLATHSDDGGQTWASPKKIETGTSLPRISLGALSSTSGGHWVLSGCAWQASKGRIDRVGQQPPGVNRYRLRGFRIEREPFILRSEDGARWTSARADWGPFLAPASCGRIIHSGDVLFLPIFGPTSKAQLSGAIGDLGLLRSSDGGTSWAFSHWIARGSSKEGRGWGPSDLTVLPDGRWLAMLEGRWRSLGGFSRPRICRSESQDGGCTWSEPEHQLLGPAPSLVSLGGEEIMTGTWYETGMIYNVSRDAGRLWDYQNLAWDCIWYADFDRGGLRLLPMDPKTILAVFHWGSEENIKTSQVKAVRIHQG